MVKKERGKIVFLVFSMILILSVFHGSVIAPDTTNPGTNSGFGFGSSNGEITNSMQAVQQILQIITQLFGNLKSNAEANAQAENTRLAKINAPRLPDDPADTQSPSLNTEVIDNRVQMNFTGMEITLQDRNTGNKLIIQNRASVVGMINTNSSLENIITRNTTTIVTKNNVDLGVVKVGNETTLIDSGGATTSSASNSNTVAGFLPLVSAAETNGFSKEFSRQYVVFIEDDVFINGDNILFFPLKPFDQIIVNGSKLVIMEQDSDVVINNDRTFYSRKIGKSNFFVKKIINENNRDFTFSLLDGGKKGTYFIDNKKVLSVGDDIVQNPLSGYENLSIPKTRFEMWKRAEENI